MAVLLVEGPRFVQSSPIYDVGSWQILDLIALQLLPLILPVSFLPNLSHSKDLDSVELGTRKRANCKHGDWADLPWCCVHHKAGHNYLAGTGEKREERIESMNPWKAINKVKMVALNTFPLFGVKYTFMSSFQSLDFYFDSDLVHA